VWYHIKDVKKGGGVMVTARKGKAFTKK